MKECNINFPRWTNSHTQVFKSIQKAIIGHDCLMTIDHCQMPEMKNFVTTDASNFQSGAVLSFGETWESTHLVVFDLITFKGAELNYPVHEKEMLAIIHALEKWHSDLIGVPIVICIDHKMLENFDIQKDLSHWQARWMEFMSQYEYKIIYVKGEDNTVADALSWINFDTGLQDAAPLAMVGLIVEKDSNPLVCAQVLSDPSTNPGLSSIASTLSVFVDAELFSCIQENYVNDPWCKQLLNTDICPHGIHICNGLLYTGSRLIVPHVSKVHE
jgi:hypothetical protein